MFISDTSAQVGSETRTMIDPGVDLNSIHAQADVDIVDAFSSRKAQRSCTGKRSL
jgi:hypothetical protein